MNISLSQGIQGDIRRLFRVIFLDNLFAPGNHGFKVTGRKIFSVLRFQALSLKCLDSVLQR
ncbi:MAG: hypothetical protein ABR523_00595, partial [Desulfurivibrionaceae bacterium]